MITTTIQVTPREALLLACDAVGGRAVLAARLGVSTQAISRWIHGSITAERAVEVEEATGGRITREQLRPDLFRRAPRASASHATTGGA